MKRVFTKVFSPVFLAFVCSALGFTAQAQTFTKAVATSGTNDHVSALTSDKFGNVWAIVNPTNGSTSSLVEYVGGTGSPQTISTGFSDNDPSDGSLTDGLASDSHGNIYESDNSDVTSGVIYKYTYPSYTKSTLVTGSANIGYFQAITVGPDDNLYVVQYNANGNTANTSPASGDWEIALYSTTSVVTNTGSVGGTVLYNNLDNQFFVGYHNNQTTYDAVTAIVGLQVDASLNIYVADGWDDSQNPNNTNGGHIYKLLKPGSGNTYTLGSTVSSNLHATALAMDATRTNLYASLSLTSDHAYSVVKYTNGTGSPTTLYTGLTSAGLYFPFGLAYVSDTKFFVSDGFVDASDTGNLDIIYGTPTNQASNVSFSSIGTTSATASWTNGGGSTRAVFINQTSSTSSTPSPSNGTAYTAAVGAYTGGTQAGSGWYCVYNGTGTSTSISGLSAGTPYRVAVIEYNGTTGSQNYLATAGTGNPANFTTASPTIIAPGGTTTVPTAISGSAGSSTSFAISASNLSANVTATAPTNFQVSSDNSSWNTTATITQSGGTITNAPVYVRLSGSGSVGSQSGNVSLASSGATTVNQAVSGTLNSASTTISSLTATSGTTTNAASISWTATFAASVSGLSSSDFGLSTSGVSGASITGVSGSGTSWTITASTGSGDGTIQLVMNGTSGVTPSVSNIPFAGSTYTIDKTAPSIAIGSPSLSATNGGPVTYTVTYSDTHFSSSTLGTGNITLNKTGNANGTVAVSGSGTSYTVTISSITGDGSLGFTIGAGTATDAAGNSAAASSASTTFTVDNTAPTIAIGSPSKSITNSSAVSYTVTYSDTHFSSSTLGTGNITLNKTGNANGTVAVSGSGTSYTVTISSITGDGSLGFTIGAGTATDAAGNSAAASSASTTFTVDNTAPAIAIGSPSLSATNSGPVSYTVTYSDANFSSSSLGTGNITLNKTGNANGTVAVSGSGTSYTVTISSITGTGSLGFTIGAGTATDLAGNSAAASSPSTTFTVDNTAPVVNTIAAQDPLQTNQTSLDYTVTFSKPVTGVDPSDFTVTKGGTVTSGAISVTATSSSTYNVSINGVGGDGSFRLDLNSSGTGIADGVGNPISGGFTGGDTYTVDNTPPSIAIGSPSVSSTINGPVTYTVTYSDANFATSQLVPGNITLNKTGNANGSVAVSGSGTSYTVTISSITGAGTLGISIAAGTATDQAGNSAAASSPSTTFTAGSTDATLSGLAISNGTLSPSFNSTVVAYTDAVGYAQNSIKLTPTVNDANATVTVKGNTTTSGSQSVGIALSVGDNVIPVVVTAEDGITTKEYDVTVTRAQSTNDTLTTLRIAPYAVLTPVGGSGHPYFAANEPYYVTSVTIIPTYGNGNSSVTINGSLVASGTASQPISLNVGPNTITEVITAQNGNSRTVTIIVTRAASSNANLSFMHLSNGAALSPAFSHGTTSYTATVLNAVSAMTVTPTLANANASVTVNGSATASGSASAPVNLNVGDNTITVTTTAQDGVTQMTYTVVVTRQMSHIASLSFIRLSNGTTGNNIAYSPAFNYMTTEYNASVTSAVTSVTVLARLSDPNSTLTINGNPATSGVASAPIAIHSGPNTVNIGILAADGTTTGNYDVIVTAPGSAPPITQPVESIAVATTNGLNTSGNNLVVRPGVSPNGDGVNDYLTIDGINNYPDNKLLIMNRNGALVYEAKGYDNNSKIFDGHSNKDGKLQTPGTYFYSLEYTEKGVTKHKTGYIILKY